MWDDMGEYGGCFARLVLGGNATNTICCDVAECVGVVVFGSWRRASACHLGLLVAMYCRLTPNAFRNEGLTMQARIQSMKEENWVDSDEFVKANVTNLSPELRDLLDKIFVADEFKRITMQVPPQPCPAAACDCLVLYHVAISTPTSLQDTAEILQNTAEILQNTADI